MWLIKVLNKYFNKFLESPYAKIFRILLWILVLIKLYLYLVS